MQKFILIFLALILSGCSSQAKPKRDIASELEITEVNPNQWTALTKKNMLDLHKKYDLEPYLYTNKINIQSRVIPHSHPVLTLNTRNAEFPDKILSTWLHEEFHWWTEMNGENIDKAINEFKILYPKLPTEGGARNEYSTYLHLAVCYLEYKSIIHFLGESKAKKLINEFITKDQIYTWIYAQILENTDSIDAIVRKNNLLPNGLE